MCYLCQPNGDPARKSILAALRVWKRKRCPECRRSRTTCEVGSWGDSHDWTLPPAKRVAFDFDAYQASHRYKSRATRYSFKRFGGSQLPSWGDTHDWSPYTNVLNPPEDA